MTRAASAATLAGLVLSLTACGGEGLSASGAEPPTTPAPTAPPPLTAVQAKPKPRPLGLPAPVPGIGTLTAYVTRAKVLRARPAAGAWP